MRTVNVLRSGVLSVLGAAVLAGASAAAAEEGNRRRPNIVVILADDFGYECVGANGGKSYKTPELDALAAGGMRFEHCYSQPLCTPSRVQIMTGMYNVRNYVRFGLLEEGQTTFANLLRKAGYATCVVGKWQLLGGYEGPGRFGFDEYCLWQLNRRPERYRNPGVEINGRQVDFHEGEYGPDVVSDYLCEFMARNKDRPFLVYYPMILPHDPHVPTPDSPEYGREVKGKRYFADMVAYTDKMAGKVVRKLEALGLRERTLLLFTGDNGTSRQIESRVGDRVVFGGKGQTTDAGTRVPLIASWPGVVAAGRVSQGLVDFSDFLPTVCEAAGVEVPVDLKIDGRSFLPQLRGRAGHPREWIYCWYSKDGGPTGAEFARNQRYKLYRKGNYYDISQDVQEEHPLQEERLDDAARRVRGMLQRVLDQYQDARPARFSASGAQSQAG